SSQPGETSKNVLFVAAEDEQAVASARRPELGLDAKACLFGRLAEVERAGGALPNGTSALFSETDEGDVTSHEVPFLVGLVDKSQILNHLRLQPGDLAHAPGNRRKRPQRQVAAVRAHRGPRGRIDLNEGNLRAGLLQLPEPLHIGFDLRRRWRLAADG